MKGGGGTPPCHRQRRRCWPAAMHASRCMGRLTAALTGRAHTQHALGPAHRPLPHRSAAGAHIVSAVTATAQPLARCASAAAAAAIRHSRRRPRAPCACHGTGADLHHRWHTHRGRQAGPGRPMQGLNPLPACLPLPRGAAPPPLPSGALPAGIPPGNHGASWGERSAPRVPACDASMASADPKRSAYRARCPAATHAAQGPDRDHQHRREGPRPSGPGELPSPRAAAGLRPARSLCGVPAATPGVRLGLNSVGEPV